LTDRKEKKTQHRGKKKHERGKEKTGNRESKKLKGGK
jgi:hypothetical protein